VSFFKNVWPQAAGGSGAVDGASASVPPEVADLVAQRAAAKAAQDWARADALRDQVLALGFVVVDGRQGAPATVTRAAQA
jgi:cysteinyl-tRNA synthetase